MTTQAFESQIFTCRSTILAQARHSLSALPPNFPRSRLTDLMQETPGQHFADFYQLGAQSGTPIPACGLDAHLQIDGRFGPDRAASCALQHMAALQKLGKSYCGFALFRTPSRRTGQEQPYFFYGRTAAYPNRTARNS